MRDPVPFRWSRYAFARKDRCAPPHRPSPLPRRSLSRGACLGPACRRSARPDTLPLTAMAVNLLLPWLADRLLAGACAMVRTQTCYQPARPAEDHAAAAGALHVRLCAMVAWRGQHLQHAGGDGLGPAAFPVGDLRPGDAGRRGTSAMSAPTTGLGGLRTPPARCSCSSAGPRGIEGGAERPLARAQCLTLRGLALALDP